MSDNLLPTEDGKPIKTYCNICQREIVFVEWDSRMVCPYHQHQKQTEEGIVQMYDEFNENGEEW